MHDALAMNAEGIRDIHLVGSVPLGSAGEVFVACARALGSRVRRLPDGETGTRSRWINWQRAVLERTGALEAVPSAAGMSGSSYRVRGNDGEPIEFGRLGYADAAMESWQTFRHLQQEGTISSTLRFQVSLPTPLAVVARHITVDSQPAVEAAYDSALTAELREILHAIPHDRLAIQWDVAIEIAILEGVLPAHFSPVFEGIESRLLGLAGLVPASVELGFHLCYGDAGHKHFKEPEDTSLMVRLANMLANGPRPLNWIHMPVPHGRTDAAYFQALRELAMPPSCQLFLGLVHDIDGLQGTRSRIEIARQFAPANFGIATECGFGRRDPSTVAALLKLHSEV